MRRNLLTTCFITALCALSTATSASAKWFPADGLEGPADISALSASLAREGTGAVAYAKKTGSDTHVFVRRLLLGSWQAPQQLDNGPATDPVTEVATTAGDNSRLAVIWISGTKVYGSSFDGPTLTGPTLIADGGTTTGASGLSIAMGANGTAYATYTTVDASGSHINGVQLLGTTWTKVATTLEINGAVGNNVGIGAARARVAVGADGAAVVTWGEITAGRARVYLRRIVNLQPLAPIEASVADLGGQAGGNADSPDVKVLDDTSFGWVIWRQEIGGVSRIVGRHLAGSTFDPATLLVGGKASVAPRLALTGRGVGAAVASVAGSNSVGTSLLAKSAAAPAVELGDANTAAPEPVAATSEKNAIAVAWRRDPGSGQPATLRATHNEPNGSFEPDTELSRPQFGAVVPGTLTISGDRIGDFIVAWLQGAPGARTVAVAEYARVPTRASLDVPKRAFVRKSRPVLKWNPGLDLWGVQAFKVMVDGVEIGRSTTPSFTPTRDLRDGRHTLTIITVDRRGQTVSSVRRTLRIDAHPPKVKLKVTGARRHGTNLKMTFSVTDRGSGVKSFSANFGDKSGKTSKTTITHTYKHAGTFTVIVRSRDKAGNVGTSKFKLKIK